MTRTRSAIVVGGGIGGLATAIGLVGAGWRVTVLERSADAAEIGAGFALTGNGMAALKSLGLGAAADGVGHRLHMDGAVDQRGRRLFRIPRDDTGRSTIQGTHRQALHQLLLSAANEAEIRTATRVTRVEPGAIGGALARVHSESGIGLEQMDADLVVGADGIRSVVRGSVDPSAAVRYGGWSSWRGIADDAHLALDTSTIMWGPGAEFGALRINPAQLYWYGYARVAAGTVFDDERAAVLERFAGWAHPVHPLIDATPPDQLMRHDVSSLRPQPRRYVNGRVVLAGDAAHAMLPTMGQGVNTALEDAATLGALARLDLGETLHRYQAERHRRTQSLARQSETVARMGAHLSAAPLVAARNALLRLMPGRLAGGAGGGVIDWDPPTT